MTAALTPGRPFTGSERQLLDNTLQLHRAELVAAVSGLTDTQARLHLVPSLTTPISLVKHCAAAERIWFQRTLAGWTLDECTGQAVGGDASFHVGDHETLDLVVAEYQAACATSDDIAHRIIDTSGKVRFVIVVGEGLHDEDGRIVGTHGFYIDTTPDEREQQDQITAQLAVIAEDRAVIEQAKGVLMAAYGIEPNRAFEILVWRSQETNVRLRELAARFMAAVSASHLSPESRGQIDHTLLTLR
jgi:hypothetical protein